MVGNIETVIAKAEVIAAEVAKAKSRQVDTADEGSKKKAAVDPNAAKVDRTSADFWITAPRPTQTNDEIRKELHALAMECKNRDLAYAAEIKKNDTGSGELQVGWRFPKEASILQGWGDWEKLFEKQTDLIQTFADHFAKSTQRLAEERAKDLAEFGALG